MSLFADHITNQDDFILQNFDLRLSSDYKNIMVLVEKQHEGQSLTDWGWRRKIFVPLDIVWKDYIHEGFDDIVTLYGVRNRPTKRDFMEFVQTFSHPDIKKLIFHQATYIDRSILRPIYEAFNKHWCFENYNNKKLKYECI